MWRKYLVVEAEQDDVISDFEDDHAAEYCKKTLNIEDDMVLLVLGKIPISTPSEGILNPPSIRTNEIKTVVKTDPITKGGLLSASPYKKDLIAED